jgi:hypothetical protein
MDGYLGEDMASEKKAAKKTKATRQIPQLKREQLIALLLLCLLAD